jgi:lysophospholipase L1-like esterase
LLSRRPDPPPFRVPLEEYRENLQSMLDEVGRSGGRVVLVAAPYRFGEKNEQRHVANAYLLPDDDAVSIHRSYLDVVREFIGRKGATVLGADAVFAALSDTPPLFRDDGIHFTNEGHRVMAALLAEHVRSGAGPEGTAAPELLEAARRSLAHPTRLQPTSG